MTQNIDDRFEETKEVVVKLAQSVRTMHDDYKKLHFDIRDLVSAIKSNQDEHTQFREEFRQFRDNITKLQEQHNDLLRHLISGNPSQAAKP